MPTPYSPPGHHRLAELLQLVGAVRRVVFDANLPAVEALGRVRDLYRGYDQGDPARSE